MVPYVRLAVAATVSFCAVAAPAETLVSLTDQVKATTLLPVPPQPESLNALTTPAPSSIQDSAQDSAQDLSIETPPVHIDPPATSLTQLVLRHSSMATDTPELECLAAAVYFESKGEPLAGQLAVAHVIKNRSKLSRFASTYCGVVRQAGQFSFVRGSGFPPVARSSANWRTAVAIATIADRDLWDAPAANALYFHARRVAPGWRMVRLASVGNHVFYR